MSEMASSLLKRIRALVDSKNQPGTEGQVYWGAASQALSVVESRADILDAWSSAELMEFFASWKADSNQGVQLAAIAAADARSLIAALRASTDQVEADTDMRAQRRDDLLAMGRELGFVGVKVLMALALGALA